MKHEVYELEQIDYQILARLPEQGTKLGTSTIAPTAKYLRESMNEAASSGAATAGLVTGRLRSMKHEGLVVSTKINGSSRQGGHGGVLGWQRTPKGRKALEQHQREEQ